MAKEINILNEALPRQRQVLSPEALPSAEELDRIGMILEKLRQRCRLVSLTDAERAELEPPLEPKDTYLLEQVAALLERFPFVNQILGIDAQLFPQLKSLGLSLEQLEGAAAELEAADVSGQVVTLHGITADADAVDTALARRSDDSQDRQAFSPLVKVRDMARIRALAKAERTRNRQKAEQQALGAEAERQKRLARGQGLTPASIKETP